MIRTIRLFIKGESPMSAPVSGFRSGAPGGSASKRDHDENADQPVQREPQSSRLFGRRSRALLGRPFAVVFAKPRLDHPFRDHGADHAEQNARHDGEIQVGRQIDASIPD